MNSGFCTYPGALLPGRGKAAKLKQKLQLGELDGRSHPFVVHWVHWLNAREPLLPGLSRTSICGMRSSPKVECSRPILPARPKLYSLQPLVACGCVSGFSELMSAAAQPAWRSRQRTKPTVRTLTRKSFGSAEGLPPSVQARTCKTDVLPTMGQRAASIRYGDNNVMSWWCMPSCNRSEWVPLDARHA